VIAQLWGTPIEVTRAPSRLSLRLALSPTETYRHLIASLCAAPGFVRSSVQRSSPSIIATAVTLSSARRVPLGLVLMGIDCWAFVPLVHG
jgi:hypothetical protein